MKIYEDETLTVLINLLSSLTSLMQCYISIFNTHKNMKKLH